MKLFYIIIGCIPKGRHTEQHDVFFGIAKNIRDLVPEIINFWPEAKGKLHVDAYREVNFVDDYQVEVVEKSKKSTAETLFFFNLGGYLPDVLQEYHQQVLVVEKSLSEATQKVKSSAFYKDYNQPNGASSHIDDKYALDVDDAFAVEDILPLSQKEKFSLKLTKTDNVSEDKIYNGYFKLDKL
jgi:hypothetical protein